MIMIKTQITEFYQFYPCNVALVGACKGEQVNFMAAAWNTGLSFKPPLFGVAIAPQRYTYGLITESREFTCNFLSIEHLKQIHGTGRVSGRDIDKVKAFRIDLEESQVIDCPTIASAYAAYECRLVHQYPVGDHDFFVGEVVAIHTDPEVIQNNGLLDPEKIPFTLYLGSNTYLSTDPRQVISMPVEITLPGS